MLNGFEKAPYPWQEHDLFSILQVFVLPQECIQCTLLERRMANPYSEDFDNSTIPL
jgi:hypothetical protein